MVILITRTRYCLSERLSCIFESVLCPLRGTSPMRDHEFHFQSKLSYREIEPLFFQVSTQNPREMFSPAIRHQSPGLMATLVRPGWS